MKMKEEVTGAKVMNLMDDLIHLQRVAVLQITLTDA